MNCPHQAAKGPCCVGDKPACAYNLTSPFSTSGSSDYATLNMDGIYCWAAPTPACPGTGALTVLWQQTVAACPTSGLRQVTLALNRAAAVAGSSIDLSSKAAWGILAFSDGTQSPGVTCSMWTGTINFVSDAPSWSVMIDATCVATPSLRLVGTLSGAI